MCRHKLKVITVITTLNWYELRVEKMAQEIEIPRIESASLDDHEFQAKFFSQAQPVIITGATDDWPARNWTVETLMERVGDNEVWIRGKTNMKEYQVGKKYTIRKDTFRNYCHDLLAANSRARSSYLAVASMQQAFPQLLDEVPLPKYLTSNGKLHLGPYMWVALKNHYEFCHFDPDDNFLVIIQGSKKVRLYGHDLGNMYPNPLGSHGKTIQCKVNCDDPDLDKYPNFSNALCQSCVLEPGEMLFIPAFFWHQVSALDTGISINMFYGDGGRNNFVAKILKEPYLPHFKYWLLNIIDQNKCCDSFERILARLPEVLFHFCVKQWHEECEEKQIELMVIIVKQHLGIEELPAVEDNSKFPPVLKIRGLLHRDDTKLN